MVIRFTVLDLHLELENVLIEGLFTPGHFMCFHLSDSYQIVKRPGVNAFHNAFETDLNPIAQTTSGGGLGHIPD